MSICSPHVGVCICVYMRIRVCLLYESLSERVCECVCVWVCVCGTLVSTQSDNNVYSVATEVCEVDKFRLRFTQSAKIFVWSSNIGAPAHPMLTMSSFFHSFYLDEG